MEVWKPIPSEPGYEASDLGRVRSVDRVVFAAQSAKQAAHERKYKGQVLKPGRTPSGHLTVSCGRKNSRSVHVLVLEAFVGFCPLGQECLHKNDKPWENHLENLRWGTRSENLEDNTRFGKNKISLSQIRTVRSRHIPNCRDNGGAALSRELGISINCVYHLTSGGYSGH